MTRNGNQPHTKNESIGVERFTETGSPKGVRWVASRCGWARGGGRGEGGWGIPARRLASPGRAGPGPASGGNLGLLGEEGLESGDGAARRVAALVLDHLPPRRRAAALRRTSAQRDTALQTDGA